MKGVVSYNKKTGMKSISYLREERDEIKCPDQRESFEQRNVKNSRVIQTPSE